MAYRCALALVLCTGCFFKPDPPSGTESAGDGGIDGDGTTDAMMTDAVPAQWLPNYAHRRRITLTRPTAPPGPLVNFPVSVLIENDNDLRDDPQTGLELVFTGADGQTMLEYEIRRYAKLAGTLEAWVRVPALDVGATEIYLYYGGPELTNRQPELVWGNAYGIWHMDTSGDEDDVMRKVDALTGELTMVPSRVPGLVGFARAYDGNDYLCTDQTNVLPVGSNAFSFSLWAEPIETNSSLDSPLARGGDDSNPGFAIVLGSAPWESVVTDGNVKSVLDLGLPSTSWTYVAVSVDNPNSTVTAYVNGEQKGASMTFNLGSLGQSSSFCIGSSTAPFSGVIDEVRVWGAAHSEAWFATEHLNIANRGMFMSVAPEESL